ncbi:ATP-binding protein [Bradyrhizobium sp. Y36]|uniref:ATP-binding protein n=1 Tax=Bradyrhizobium sp. Y36 TaxID=2035447 RepID=UPI000BEABB55|nr:ATP-binding protein [Bradyrhizobium sp. Y36]PDT88754.1 ATP-binding protein [Bradyrhizobium sp. Y36]
MEAGVAQLRTRSFESPRLAYWDGVSPNSLSLALSPPVIQCVENGLEGRLKARRERAIGQLSLLVSTRSAYRHPIGRRFVEAIERRTAISGGLHERIDTAVQEALMNGLLHGNLNVDANARRSLESLGELHRSIASELDRLETARCMIQLDALWSRKMLYVIVRDNGDGYQRDQLPVSPTPDEHSSRSSGRGLSILGAVCDRVAVIEGGKTIKLGFRL